MTVCNSRGFGRGVGVVGGWIKAIALVVVVLAGYSRAEAQCPAGWLQGPSASNGLSGLYAYALAVLPGGDAIVGGSFNLAGDLPANNVARYHSASNTWSALGSGVNGRVYDMVVLPSGDLIVVGRFTTAGGVPATNIARCNPATGEWSALGSGVNSYEVRKVAVLANGDLIVGGQINSAGGVPVSGIARYNPGTGVWSSLGSGVTATPYATVSALAVLPSGDLIVGGGFSNAGGVPVNNIARYNPATDAWSALGSGMIGGVNAFLALPNGDLIVGGSFTNAGGATSSGIARYNPATGVWSGLGSGVTGPYNTVWDLAVLPGGDLIVCGEFTTAGGIFSNKVARYTPATNTWSPLGVGVNDSISDLVTLPGGDVIAGGVFTTAGGLPANRIARYTPATGVWSPLGNGVIGPSSGAPTPRVNFLAALPNGDVIVGGSFINAGNVSAQNIARYNPTTRVWSGLGSGLNFIAYCVAVLPGGDLIVGGPFTRAGGVPVNGIARYNPTTRVWSALGSGLGGTYPYATDLLIIPGGDVIVGGDFTIAGGVPANRIARYNPVTGVWSALGQGLNGAVNSYHDNARVSSMVVLPGGDVIVGGDIATAGGVPANGIARYNPATGVWSALGSGVSGEYSSVYKLAVLPDGDIIVGGSFTTAGGVPANNIARHNPVTGVWSPLGSGVNGYVSTLTFLPSGDLIAAGRLSLYQTGFTGGNLARYTFGTPTPTITTQPSPQRVCLPAAVTFSVAAAGTGPFTYQWRQGGTPINTTTNPSAATGTLGLTNVQAGDAGAYDCVVGTTCGSITSAAATLTVVPCPCGLSDIAGPGQSIGNDGVVTADDIIVFLNWFFAGDTRADVAGTVPDGQFTATDIIVFLNRFFAGC